VVDPSGSDSISYQNPGTPTISSAGTAAGIQKLSKTAFEALPSAQIGVLDFESANGWNQTAYPIRVDQASTVPAVYGRGSSLDSGRDITPYVSSDAVGAVSVSGKNLEVSFSSYDPRTGLDTGKGVYRELDPGNSSSLGYIVTSGSYGITAPGLDSSNKALGIKIEFSVPVQAAGLVCNTGNPGGSSKQIVVFYDEAGTQLLSYYSGIVAGSATWWAASAAAPVIKSMVIYDYATSTNYTLDSVAFIVPAPATQAPVFSPGGKYISGPTMISMTCPTEGSKIHYTLNGATPTANSTEYTGPVSVNNGDVLQAVAVATDTSTVTSRTYAIPASYNQPVSIPYGSANVDGDLSDWSGASWTSLNVDSEIATTADALHADVPEAYYAARWQMNRIYVAVKVHDKFQYLTDSYTAWDARDAIEVYLHTDNDGADDYSAKNTIAQQYEVGIKTNKTSVWAAVGANAAYDITSSPEIAIVAGKGEGEWLYYEITMTPYTYFGVLEGTSSLASQLFGGEVIGLDVDVICNNNGTYLGKKSENNLLPRYNNWQNFGLHKLGARISVDANDDGKVDVGDLGILAANYGLMSDATWAKGDFNGDGKVDVGDLGILAANYGTGSSSSDFTVDYAKVFSCLNEENENTSLDDTSSTFCSGLGLSLIAGLALMGLMLVKTDE
jgi:hypothetical protein